MASSPYSPYTPPAGQMPSGQSPPRNAKTLHKLAANNDGNDSSPTNGSHHQDTESLGVCACCLYMLSTAFFVLTFPFTWCFLIKIVNQYERAVIFRLGQLTPGGAKGPGLFFINPCTDVYRKVDMRTVMIDVPPQEVLTKDSVTVKVDAVVYFHVFDATIAIVNVARASDSTKLLSQTTLRTVLGTKTLTELLVERDQIREEIREVLDEATDGWGIKVERVEITDVKLPKQMQRMMAAEAEADREAKAKVVAAEGEKRASMALRDAAATMADAPATLQLRYLQTLQTISSEHNSTIVFPFPVDLIAALLDRIQPSPAKTWATASSQPPSGISRIHHPPPPLPHRPHHQLATTPPAMDQQQPPQLPQNQLLQVVVQQPQQLYEDVEHVTDPSMRTAQQITL